MSCFQNQIGDFDFLPSLTNPCTQFPFSSFNWDVLYKPFPPSVSPFCATLAQQSQSPCAEPSEPQAAPAGRKSDAAPFPAKTELERASRGWSPAQELCPSKGRAVMSQSWCDNARGQLCKPWLELKSCVLAADRLRRAAPQAAGMGQGCWWDITLWGAALEGGIFNFI